MLVIISLLYLPLLSPILSFLPGVLPYRDHFGRVILTMYTSNWDETHYSLISIYRAVLLTLEKLIEVRSRVLVW